MKNFGSDKTLYLSSWGVDNGDGLQTNLCFYDFAFLIEACTKSISLIMITRKRGIAPFT